MREILLRLKIVTGNCQKICKCAKGVLIKICVFDDYSLKGIEMYCYMHLFNYLLDEDSQLRRIEEILSEFPCPEDINGGATTAPSKRLMAIFNYDKTADSSDILELIGFNTIYSQCPRFASWFDSLVNVISS